MTRTYLPKHHALLYSMIAKHTLAKIGNSAAEDIKEMTKAYGKDRAARMTKRAVFDGVELNALSYLSYGELDVPKEIIKRTTELDGESALQTTTKCPWYDAWAKAKHLEYGKLFCEVFDEALANGFHHSVKMKVPVTITTGDSYCKFIFEHSRFTEDDKKTLALRNEKLKKSATKPFIYHMGHLYSFLSKELEQRYGEVGKEIIKNALEDYADYFDTDTVSDILNMKDIDYSSIADYENE